MIEETRNAPAELLDSEMSFRILVQNLKDYALYMLDPDGRVISWNEGAEQPGTWSGEVVAKVHNLSARAPEEVVPTEEHTQEGRCIGANAASFLHFLIRERRSPSSLILRPQPTNAGR
ncbi:MAG: hypothetical protein ACRD9S_07215 [Pyrinomonadaceae bacterium]